MSVRLPALGATSCALGLALVWAGPVAAQRWEAGLGFAVANTTQNAVALGGTLNHWRTVSLGGWGPLAMAIRGFADAELGMRDFNEGLGYDEEEERQQIRDHEGDHLLGRRQWPNEDDLWQMAGWDVHAALYGTVQLTIPYLSMVNPGVGWAWNRLDGTSGPSVTVVTYVASRAELDVELLDIVQTWPSVGRWRARISLDFWLF